jgi:hypothetical protein
MWSHPPQQANISLSVFTNSYMRVKMAHLGGSVLQSNSNKEVTI